MPVRIHVALLSGRSCILELEEEATATFKHLRVWVLRGTYPEALSQ